MDCQWSEGLPKGLEGLLEGSEGSPEGPKGLSEGPKGLSEGLEGLPEGPQGLPIGPKGLLEGPQGLPRSPRRDRWKNVQMDRISPHFTGLCPLLGLLPCYPLETSQHPRSRAREPLTS